MPSDDNRTMMVPLPVEAAARMPPPLGRRSLTVLAFPLVATVLPAVPKVGSRSPADPANVLVMPARQAVPRAASRVVFFMEIWVLG